jgi:hypothetical protein
MGLTVQPHGECEYCEGGSGHDELMASVPRLKKVAPGGGVSEPPRGVFLPMAGAQASSTIGSCGSGGCTSCGAHH